MPKSSTIARDVNDVSAMLKASRADVLPYRQFFDTLSHVIPVTEGLITTTLPRGTLQIAQPQRLPESLLRNYARQFHAEDRLTWQSITQGRALSIRECWTNSDFESSRYYQDFLRVHGLMHGAAAPLAAPVIEGYPGSIHLYRSEDLPPFSEEELEQLRSIAAELDEAISRTRSARRNDCPRLPEHDLPARQFIFDQNLNLVLPQQADELDERLRQNMLDYARFRLGHVNGKAIESDRVSLPDGHGDLRHFRVVVHQSYPALGEGPLIFFCLQPPCNDWSTLRPTDFQADVELARLVPAMKFMRENFSRGPTLTEIARIVHLSPFHFHRRFTELLGITPKHFMLDCQIEQAKCELLAREKDLAEIAAECGFAHQSHFTSRFKQATGLTPTRWRRMATEAGKTSQN